MATHIHFSQVPEAELSGWPWILHQLLYKKSLQGSTAEQWPADLTMQNSVSGLESSGSTVLAAQPRELEVITNVRWGFIISVLER